MIGYDLAKRRLGYYMVCVCVCVCVTMATGERALHFHGAFYATMYIWRVVPFDVLVENCNAPSHHVFIFAAVVVVVAIIIIIHIRTVHGDTYFHDLCFNGIPSDVHFTFSFFFGSFLSLFFPIFPSVLPFLGMSLPVLCGLYSVTRSYFVDTIIFIHNFSYFLILLRLPTHELNILWENWFLFMLPHDFHSKESYLWKKESEKQK